MENLANQSNNNNNNGLLDEVDNFRQDDWPEDHNNELNILRGEDVEFVDSTNGTNRMTASRKRKFREDQESTSHSLGVDMSITSDEKRLALAIKEAVLCNKETKNITVSDMELVQYAMVEGDNIPRALERLKKVHEWKTKYKIEDTPEHGTQCVRDFVAQQPGFLLNIDQCSRHKHFVQVMDMAKFQPRKVYLPSDWKTFMSGLYYITVAVNPSLESVRKGILAIAEFEGFGWDNFCIEFERQFWDENLLAYPFKIYEMSWVRTPLVANVFFSLLKPIMPEEMRRKIHIGVKFDESFDGRLDELFLKPTLEKALERQLATTKTFLERRYHNVSNFRLENV